MRLKATPPAVAIATVSATSSHSRRGGGGEGIVTNGWTEPGKAREAHFAKQELPGMGRPVK
jgi:hypothetical protein